MAGVFRRSGFSRNEALEELKRRRMEATEENLVMVQTGPTSFEIRKKR